jgi:hypothetical protein
LLIVIKANLELKLKLRLVEQEHHKLE